MGTTEIFANPAVNAMRAMALSMLDRVQFRHHGIGALQGYVSEKTEPEVRIHIWSRALLKSGMDASGDIHDHRFDMVSHVLCGFVEHEEFFEEESSSGQYAMMSLTHARAAADTAYHGPTTPLPGRFLVQRRRHTISRGWSYRFAAQTFHRSPLDRLQENEVVVTCVEKHLQRDVPARLLYPLAVEPVMAFGHIPDRKLIESVIFEAKHRLSRE